MSAEIVPTNASIMHVNGKTFIGELAAVTRPWLQWAVQHSKQEVIAYISGLPSNVDVKRFQSSISASASYFYGRRSMTTRLLRNCDETIAGVAFTFIGSTKPIRPFNATKRADTHPVSIDQSTPT